jgi:DNA repair protein RadC
MELTSRKKRINGSHDVAPIFRAILDAEGEMDRDKEHFWCLCLDTKNHILRIELVTLGLLDQTVVHPREVFRPAISCSAKSIVLAHNHPSGDPQPSDKDVTLTARLIECSRILDIQILDHVVVGEGADYWSMQEHNDQHHIEFN